MAFYDEMAELAAEMLAEFGTRASLTTYTSTYDKKTSRQVSSVSSTRTAKALLAKIEETVEEGRKVLSSTATLDAKPSDGEKLSLGGVDWTVGKVTTVKPTTKVIIYYAEVRA